MINVDQQVMLSQREFSQSKNEILTKLSFQTGTPGSPQLPCCRDHGQQVPKQLPRLSWLRLWWRIRLPTLRIRRGIRLPAIQLRRLRGLRWLRRLRRGLWLLQEVTGRPSRSIRRRSGADRHRQTVSGRGAPCTVWSSESASATSRPPPLSTFHLIHPSK